MDAISVWLHDITRVAFEISNFLNTTPSNLTYRVTQEKKVSQTTSNRTFLLPI
jgi:hypothetical protein